MNILCCYINPDLSIAALESFRDHAPAVVMVNCTGDWTDRQTMKDSMTRYWTEIRKRWAGEEDLAILSQRACIDSDTLFHFEKCNKLICYKNGAVRYAVELQQKITRDDIGGEYMVWHMVNERLMKLWRLHAIEVCINP